MGASQVKVATTTLASLARIAAAGGRGVAPSAARKDLVLAGLGDGLDQLEAAGLVRRARRRLSLSDAGLEAYRQGFGEKPPRNRSWGELRDTRLMALALGIAGRPADYARLRTAKGLRLATLATALGLPRSAAASLAALKGALARKTGSKRSAPANERALAQAAAHHAGAADAGVFALRRALLARLAPAPAGPMQPGPGAILAAARAVADVHARGIPGSRRLLIAEAIAHLRRLHPGWRIDENGLKAVLLDAHRQGLVSLATADLRSAKDLAAIRASEVRHLSGSWHYIRAEDR